MMGWNPSGNPAGTQRAVVQNPLSVLRPDSHQIPPWGALMDKWGSGSSAVSPEVYFCHTRVCAPPCSMHLQPCGMRLGGLVVHVHHVLSCVPWWLVNKLCSSLLPGHKHVDMHAVKPGHALRSVLSQFVCFLVTVTFWRHSGCSQDIWPHVLRILTIRDLVWLLLFLYLFNSVPFRLQKDGTQRCRDSLFLFFWNSLVKMEVSALYSFDFLVSVFEFREENMPKTNNWQINKHR